MKTFRLNPQVYMTAAATIVDGQFFDPNVAIQAASKHHLPEGVDAEEYKSAHLALLYYQHAPIHPQRHRLMKCTNSAAGRRWFCLGIDVSRDATSRHPWWAQRKDDVTAKIRADRVAALQNLAQLALKFRLPQPAPAPTHTSPVNWRTASVKAAA